MKFSPPDDTPKLPQSSGDTSISSPRCASLLNRRDFGAALAACSAPLAFLSPALSSASDTWEQIDDRDGIFVSRMKLSQSPLHAFRGKTVIDAPLGKVIWTLSDNQHRGEWVDRLVKSVILEERGSYEAVVYQHYKTPPIVSDRDFVYRARAISRQDGSAVLEISSVEHAQAPPSVGVRGELKRCSYVLTPQGPNKTHIDVIIMTDPKGSLPVWLINMIQKSWPRNTLLSMKEHVKKPFVGTMAAPPLG